MSKKIFFFLFLTLTAVGSWTCSKDDDNNNNADPCTGSWATDLSNEANAMMNAAQVYASNPTIANCNAYKQAAQDYLDALEPYGNCATLTGQDRVEWQTALDNAQASINAMTCQ